VIPLPSRTGKVPPAVLSWSTGKDAAYALHRVRQSRAYDVVALLTTVQRGSGRVATHGVRTQLLSYQAASVGLPLVRVPLPLSPSNSVYEQAFASALQPFRAHGIRHVVFGDLFLEDIREYRERQLARLGMEAVFPLWGKDTRRLAAEMIRAGQEARLVSVDTGRLPTAWAGRSFDSPLQQELPPGVDACGENGEFHTFVTAGPVLRWPIPVRVGSIRTRDGFAAADLRLAVGAPTHRPSRTKHKSRGVPEGAGGSIG
jgi:uncharacterized protein (TIGR00290 family)